ncbi:SusC/RagA family TonB-linked outer membrane protein [Autumnicola musiva]|uniref:SusC/RagA family TonB-linked outer membrane protein n=1 Tax=Autumnicola musiva TaxID=3075589 RepID=A0ABU3D4T2_9FLAO|nr:SusC/RagA family TonB-linked outer membrane protein [Zunongwangia sp. F117]MDT0676540.1 SusC/RagA family TonB-linked outer membrane protein [Zunongwangia sp. F117]
MKKIFIKTFTIVFTVLCLGVVSVQAQEETNVTLNDEPEEERDSIVQVPFGTKSKKDILGAVSTVNIEDLLKKNYQTNALDGVESFVGGYTGDIWGQNPLILIDGVPRSLDNVNATEVETVTVLKGASAVVLYGSRAAKGVVLITTKRGKQGPLTIEARANTGIFVPKSYPNYLDAASYMTLYNEASDNDGVARIYDEATIYNTAEGVNPFKYPDIDYISSDYLKEYYNRSDATVEVSGGDEKTQYYTNFGASYNDDIIDYGEQRNNSDLNLRLRGNVDMKLSEWLSAEANASVIFNNNYIGRGDFWGASASMRPNWFTPLVPISSLTENERLQSFVDNSNFLIDGQYLLGGNNAVQTNALADMLGAGYIRYKSRTFLYKVSAMADLSGITKGLTFNNSFSLDYDNYFSEAYREEYRTYNPVWSNMNGEDIIVDLNTYGDDVVSSNEYVGDSRYTQTMSFFSQLNYLRTFSDLHNVTGNLIGWGFQSRASVDEGHDGSDYQSTVNTNLGLQLAYNYAHKYYVDFSSAVVHSPKLPEGNRTAFSPTVTLGWRMSDEGFMDGASFIDNLKLTASYANLHQDLDIQDYYMYQGYFDDNAWYQWRDGTMGGNAVLSGQGANPNLSFITREEYRVGLDGSLFGNSIVFDANYFNQLTDGLLSRGASTLFPSYFNRWDHSFLPNVNFNKDRRTGYDFSVSHQNEVGDFKYNFGVAGMVYDSEAVVRDEVYQDAYQYRAGKPVDASFGYIAEGFFGDLAEIENHATQTFGNVKPGDIKYTDVNGDGVVDQRDQVELGRSRSPFTYGLNLTLNYKNWSLFAMGQGQFGAIGYKNSSYFWVYGTRKYSEEVLGRWTPETANTATYPRLSTTGNTNNFRNSSFWMYDNNRFDLTHAQLTFDFPETVFQGTSLLSELSLYLSGQNLFTISKERKMMEMNIGSAPQYRFYNFGVKAKF